MEAVDPVDGHRPLVVKLQEVLCVKEPRVVSNDGCVQWSGKVLQLEEVPGRVRPRVVEVWSSAGSGTVQAIRSAAVVWSWQELASRPRKAVVPRLQSVQGPAHRPTEKMRRQIGDLFNRRDARPVERLLKKG